MIMSGGIISSQSLYTDATHKPVIHKNPLKTELTFLTSNIAFFLVLPSRMSKVPGQKVNIVSNFVRIVHRSSNIISLIATYPYRG